MLTRLFHIAHHGFQFLLKRKGSTFLLLILVLLLLYAYVVPPPAAEIPNETLKVYNTIGAEPEGAGRGFSSTLYSPVFVGLVALLSLIMITSILKRGKRLHRSVHRSTVPSGGVSAKGSPVIVASIDRLHSHRYRCRVTEESGTAHLVAEKGRWGEFGSIIFHFGLLTIIAGIAFSTLSSKNESILLTEGESYQLVHGGGSESGLADERPAFQSSMMSTPVIRLVSYDSLTHIGDLRAPAAVLHASDNGHEEVAKVHMNSSLTLDGRKIHLGASHGFSPYLEVIGPAGEKLCSAFIRIAALKNGSHSDFIDIDGGRIRLFLTLYPSTGNEATDSSPRLVLRLRDKLGEQCQTELSLGTTRKVNNYTVTFADMREWVQLDIAERTGPDIIAFGAVLGLLGLAIRLLYFRKRIRLQWDNGVDGSYHLRGEAEYFPQLFVKELDILRRELSEDIQQLINGNGKPQSNTAEDDKNG